MKTVQLWCSLFYKKKISIAWNELPTPYSIRKMPDHDIPSTLEILCSRLHIFIQVYILNEKEGYKKFELEGEYPHVNSLGRHGNTTMTLFTQDNHWAFLKRPKHGELKIIQRYYCKTCCTFIFSLNEQSFLQDHLANCTKCHCGRGFPSFSTHFIHCTNGKLYGREKTDKLACKIAIPEPHKTFEQHNHHADFECCIPNQDGIFTVDSCGLWNDTTKTYHHWIGPTALRDWFDYVIDHLDGILWFFYGSKFDVHFIIQHCMQEGFPIDIQKTLIQSNTVLTLTLVTLSGIVTIKDLSKFLVGSLDANCKAFGVEQQKGSFEHEKVKTWDDVFKHKDERLIYLKADVMAQRALFLACCNAIYDAHKLNLCKYISMAQMALAISSLYIQPKRLFKIPVQDEPAFREAYFGGRLVMTFSQWKSSQFDVSNHPTGIIQKSSFDAITDYLVYLDANSLYPTQMRYKRIPCGKGKYRDASPTDILCLLDEFEYGNSTEWTSKLLLVDITPPPDLLIPFLMSRNEKNRNQQSLAPIVKKWYAGCEIMEALRLGYTLNKVHAYYEFPYYQTLFETFISNLYQERLDHPTGARNLMAKFAMNSVSGKHGQRNMDTKQSLFVGPDSMQGALKQGYKVGHSIMDQDNHMMGFIGECQDHPESTPFALQVTVWILAWSRVHMSTFIDHIGGYRNHKACPKYGDTDSVFVEHAIASKADPIYYGKALGQFKNEMPDCKLMELIILAPKTYMKIYWGPSPRKNDEYQLYCQVTCKGIPHSPSPYLYHGNYQVDKKNQKRILHIYNWIKEKQAGQHEGEYYPSVVLRDQYYLYQEEGVQTVYTHLTPTCFKKVAQGKGDLTVIFGSMQRNLQSNHLENMVVGLDYKHRLAIRENYWEGTNRVQGECYFYKPIF